jgi:hypothetical protein
MSEDEEKIFPHNYVDFNAMPCTSLNGLPSFILFNPTLTQVMVTVSDEGQSVLRPVVEQGLRIPFFGIMPDACQTPKNELPTSEIQNLGCPPPKSLVFWNSGSD